MACLDSKFRVRCVDGIRVVDASVFPRVPGSFFTRAIYILAEKATDFILAEASKHGNDKILEGVRELEVFEEDRHNNFIVLEQAKQEHIVQICSKAQYQGQTVLFRPLFRKIDATLVKTNSDGQ